MYQTPFSDQVRNDAGVPTIAVGNITEPDQVNSIIAAGRADLCALARPHLSDPFWTLHAAAELGYAGQAWPVQYLTGRRQLERELEQKGHDDMIGSGTGVLAGRHAVVTGGGRGHRRGDRLGARRRGRQPHADGPHRGHPRRARRRRCDDAHGVRAHGVAVDVSDPHGGARGVRRGGE